MSESKTNFFLLSNFDWHHIYSFWHASCSVKKPWRQWQSKLFTRKKLAVNMYVRDPKIRLFNWIILSYTNPHYINQPNEILFRLENTCETICNWLIIFLTCQFSPLKMLGFFSLKKLGLLLSLFLQVRWKIATSDNSCLVLLDDFFYISLKLLNALIWWKIWRVVKNWKTRFENCGGGKVVRKFNFFLGHHLIKNEDIIWTTILFL